MVSHAVPGARMDVVDTCCTGILSLVQMSRISLFGQYKLGTGLISVVGTSFATLSTATAVRMSILTEQTELTCIAKDL